MIIAGGKKGFWRGENRAQALRPYQRATVDTVWKFLKKPVYVQSSSI